MVVQTSTQLGIGTAVALFAVLGVFLFRATGGSTTVSVVSITGTTTPNKTITTNSSLNSGLIAHWTFDGPDMITNVSDRSGNNYNGALQGQTSTTTAPGIIGQALSFDGIDDYINMGDNDGHTGMSAMTMSVWIYYETFDSTNDEETIIGKDGAGQRAYALYINESDSKPLVIFSDDGTNRDRIDFNTALTANAWNHIAVTWDGSNIYAYRNGQSDGSQATVQTTGNINNSSKSLTIGDGYDGPADRFFTGKLDDVRIYNRALSSSEISRLYDASRPNTVDPGAKQEFYVLRFNHLLAASDTVDTFTNGVDYFLPSVCDTSRTFVRLTGPHHSGGGATSGGATQGFEEYMRDIFAGSGASSFSIGGLAAAIESRFGIEIVCYTGPSGGPNEFVVRHLERINATVSGATFDSSAISGIVDTDDVAVFITSQRNNVTNTTGLESCLFTASLESGPVVRITRGTTTDRDCQVSVAVIEFTGSNWSVQRVESADTNGDNTWSSASPTGVSTQVLSALSGGSALSDYTKAFGQTQYRHSAGADPDEAHDTWVLAGNDLLNIRHASTNDTRTRVMWIVENLETNEDKRAEAYHMEWYHSDLTGTEEVTRTESVPGDVRNFDETSIWNCQSSVDATASNSLFPIGFGTFYLSGSPDVPIIEYVLPEKDDEMRLSCTVYQWPRG